MQCHGLVNNDYWQNSMLLLWPPLFLHASKTSVDSLCRIHTHTRKLHPHIHTYTHDVEDESVLDTLVDSIGIQLLDDLRLESLQLNLGNGVRLGDHRNDVHLAVQLLHAHQIQRLESVPGGADEVQADVDAAVVARHQRSLDLQLLLQIVLELGVDVVDHRFERVVLVDLVAIAHCVTDGQLESHIALLQLVGVSLQLDAGQGMGTWCGLEAGVKQRVHQRRLAQSSFACGEERFCNGGQIGVRFGGSHRPSGLNWA